MYTVYILYIRAMKFMDPEHFTNFVALWLF